MTSYFKKKQQPQKKERKNKVPPRRKLYVNSPEEDQDQEGWNTEISHEQRASDNVISLWQCQNLSCETTALWLTIEAEVGEDPDKASWLKGPLCSPGNFDLWSLPIFFRTLLVCDPGEISNHKTLAIIFCNLSHALFKPWWDGLLLFLSSAW